MASSSCLVSSKEADGTTTRGEVGDWVLVLFVSGGGEIESFALLNGNQEVVVPPVEWKTKGKFRGQTTRDTEEVQLVTGIQSK